MAGPILYPYMKWVLEECMEREIRRLYFVFPSGWLLQQTVEAIIREEGYPICTKYLSGLDGSEKPEDLPALERAKEYLRQDLDVSDENYAFAMFCGTGLDKKS